MAAIRSQALCLSLPIPTADLLFGMTLMRRAWTLPSGLEGWPLTQLKAATSWLAFGVCIYGLYALHTMEGKLD